LLLGGYLGNEIVAAIPFFYQERFLVRTLSSPIETAMIQHLGPVFPHYDALKQDKKEFYFREFQNSLDAYIDERIRPGRISVVTSPNLLDVRPYVWNGYQVTPRYNFVKEIEDLEGVWGGFKKQLRKNIEKAGKAGLTVSEEGWEGYNLVIRLLSERYGDQAIEFRTSKEYLLDLYRRFSPDNLRVFIARFDGEPITGIIVTAYRDRLSFWVGATQTDLRGIYPVDLLQWEIIRWGNRQGYRYCEILGANVPSISYFKSRYNFGLEIYFDARRTTGTRDVLGWAYRSVMRSPGAMRGGVGGGPGHQV
jgi:hypothetical protein